MGSTPRTPNLEQLRKQAKELLRAFRAGDPLARKRVTLHLPRYVMPSRSPRALLLADALHVVARENGFPGWPALKSQVENLNSNAMVGRGGDVSREGGRAWSTQLVEDLTERATELARRGDVAGFAACMSGIPLRTLLTMRDLFLERGVYDVVVDALVAGSDHPSPRIRYICVGAMDHLADDRCVEPLRRLLEDPVPRVRRMALHALSCEACKISPLQTGDDFVALAIRRATEDSSISVRRHAAADLAARRDDPRALEALERMLAKETDRAILRYARWGLRRREEGERLG